MACEWLARTEGEAVATNTSGRLTTKSAKGLEDALFAIDLFARRMNHVIDIHGLLVEACRGKPFIAHGLETYYLVLGERDQLVTDIASWTKDLYSPGGLIGSLQSEGTKPFRVTFKSNLPYPKQNRAWREATYARVFPAAASEKRLQPNGDDFLKLKQIAEEAFDALVADRNEHRAHKHERIPPTAAPLSPAEIVPFIKRCWEFVSDLSSLGTNNSYAAPLFGRGHARDQAEDVVYAILFRSQHVMSDIYFKRLPPQGSIVLSRDALLQRVHELDEKRRAEDPDRGFNQFDLAELDERG